MGFRRGFPTEANRIAVRVRAQMGLAPTAPIEPLDICALFDVRVILLSELEPASPFLKSRHSSLFSAVTVPCGTQIAVVHNDTHHPNRRRSNICHELAHMFLGHKCTPPLTASGERARDGSVEAEANYLGGALLVTKEAALHILSNNLLADAPKLYGVSGSMLTYRLRVSGADTIHRRRIAVLS